MKKTFINIIVITCVCFIGTFASNAYSNNIQTPKTTTNTQQNVQNYISPLIVLNNAQKYLNKRVQIEAKFDKFTTLGLDYPKAMRSSEKYITFTVQRNDVVDHNIPLSEMKLFLKREYAENFIDLNTDDKIKIDGIMFSNALGDVWIDVDKIQIVEKAKKNENK